MSLQRHRARALWVAMERDFHHAVTYVVARVAGLSHDDAAVVAYAAQYVDDATNPGMVRFDNGATYMRCATAHRVLDYRNYALQATRLVWIPFHFLPGNAGLPAGEEPHGSFIDKLVTRPGSPVAHDMVRACIDDRDTPYTLQRLGITAHVFVDTWAHRGFAGVSHRVNAVKEVVRDGRIDETWRSRFLHLFSGLLSQTMGPLGHAAAMQHPDKPYLVWSYTNGRGETIARNNPGDFLVAADELCKVFRRYLAGDPTLDCEGLPPSLKRAFRERFEGLRHDDAHRRHRSWLSDLRADAFGLGRAELSYVPKGPGSWKHEALRTTRETDRDNEVFPYDPGFLTSRYKHFHDAAKAHRRAVVDDVLPRYGICVA